MPLKLSATKLLQFEGKYEAVKNGRRVLFPFANVCVFVFLFSCFATECCQGAIVRYQEENNSSSKENEYSVLGLTDHEFRQWLSEPNTPDFEARLFRVLKRLSRVGLNRWLSKTKLLDSVLQKSDQVHRYLMEGSILSIKTLKNIAPGRSDDSCYEVVFEHPEKGSQGRFVVWVSDLPEYLKNLVPESGTLNFRPDFAGDSERSSKRQVDLDLGDSMALNGKSLSFQFNAQAEGVLLGRSDGKRGLSGFSRLKKSGHIPVFVSRRLEWRPKDFQKVKAFVEKFLEASGRKEPDQYQSNLARSLTRLGRNGVDVSIFGQPILKSSKRMDARQGEVFHQMLLGLGLKDGSNLAKQEEGTPISLDVVKAIRDYNRLRPLWIQFTGNVVQVVQVPLNSDDLGRLQGLDSYFLIHMRIPISNKINIRFEKGLKRSYQNSFPITVAVAKLPAGLEPGSGRRSLLKVRGYFFRLWRYQSAATIGDRTEQIVPFIVADLIKPGASETVPVDQHPLATILLIPIGLAVFGLALAGVVGFYSKKSPRIKDRTKFRVGKTNER